jgi:hypothetical protein
MGIELEQMLARREAVADEIAAVVGRLGTLLREEQELQEHLRRAAERDGATGNAFATALSFSDVLNGELVREGLSPRRADPRFRLADLVSGQHGRYRAQLAVRKQVGRPSAA